MGRHGTSHSQGSPDGSTSRARSRTTVLTVVLVLAAGGGTFAVLRGGIGPARGACRAGTVRIQAVASPDIAPTLAQIADRARRSHTLTDGQCLDVTVTARSPADVTAQLGAPAAGRPDSRCGCPTTASGATRCPRPAAARP